MAILGALGDTASDLGGGYGAGTNGKRPVVSRTVKL
jgi:hypothetical protein